jgi:hypothetical protein
MTWWEWSVGGGGKGSGLGRGLEGVGGGEEFGGGEDRGLAGKDFIHEAGVDVGIEVGTTILDDDEAVVGVGGMEQRGKDDATGGDAEEDEGVNFFGAQDHGEVGAGEGADAVLGDDDIVTLRCDGGMDGAGRALKITADVLART